MCVCPRLCVPVHLPVFLSGVVAEAALQSMSRRTGEMGDKMVQKENLVTSLLMGFAERVLCSWSPGLLEFLYPALGLIQNFLSHGVEASVAGRVADKPPIEEEESSVSQAGSPCCTQPGAETYREPRQHHKVSNKQLNKNKQKKAISPWTFSCT